MYSQGRCPSDIESISSEESDVTSRVTTIPDSWSETDLHQKQSANQLNIPTKRDDRSSTMSASTNTSVNTLINRKPEISRTNNNQVNEGVTQNQQQKWVNPYWGADQKLNTGKTPLGTSGGDRSSSNNTNVQQLIPGSILINDRGEIANQSSEQNTPVNSITSNNSFTPGGKYVPDGSGGPGGYLAPTHTERGDVTSSTGSTTPQQQTLPGSTDKDNKSWTNPYWDTKTPNKPSSSTESWKNPYWDTKTPEKPTSSTESWRNLYWEDKTTSNKEVNGIILNNAYTFDNSSPSDHKAIPVPSFYERIYPPQIPSSSNLSSVNTQHETILSNEPPKQNVNDDQDLPYTIDSQSVAHYRGPSSSSDATNKTANLASQPTTSQNPVLPPQTTNAAPPSQITNNPPPSHITNATPSSQIANNAPPPQTTNITSSLFSSNTAAPPPPPSTNSNAFASSIYSQYPSLNPSSIMATFTEEELDSVRDALHLLETNPNAIPLSEASAQIPTLNSYPGINAASHIASMFTGNRNQPSQQQPLSSLFSQNTPNNPSSNFNPQQQPPSTSFSESMFKNPPPKFNPQQQPPSSSFPQNVSNNSQQQPPSTSILQSVFNNQPSSSNPQQQPPPSSYPQQQPPPSSYPQNISNHPSSNFNPQQSSLFSTPSYPSGSNELLRRSTKQGVIVLV